MNFTGIFPAFENKTRIKIVVLKTWTSERGNIALMNPIQVSCLLVSGCPCFTKYRFKTKVGFLYDEGV